MFKKFIKASGTVALLAAVVACGVAEGTTNEVNQVVQSMPDIWDKPEAPLLVEPVVIEGDYALAG